MRLTRRPLGSAIILFYGVGAESTQQQLVLLFIGCCRFLLKYIIAYFIATLIGVV
jgi:hypothetical protein